MNTRVNDLVFQDWERISNTPVEQQDLFSATSSICKSVGDIIDWVTEKQIKDLELLIYRYLLYNIWKRWKSEVSSLELMKMSFLILRKDLNISISDSIVHNTLSNAEKSSTSFLLDANPLAERISLWEKAKKAIQKKNEELREEERKKAVEQAKKIGDAIWPMVNSFYWCLWLVNKLDMIFERVNIRSEEVDIYNMRHGNWWEKMNSMISKVKSEKISSNDLQKVLRWLTDEIHRIEVWFLNKAKQFFIFYINRFEDKIVERLWKEHLEVVFPKKEDFLNRIFNTQDVKRLDKRADLLKEYIDKYFLALKKKKEEEKKAQLLKRKKQRP